MVNSWAAKDLYANRKEVFVYENVWPPQTYPNPSVFPRPAGIGFPLARRDSRLRKLALPRIALWYGRVSPRVLGRLGQPSVTGLGNRIPKHKPPPK